MRQGGVRWGRSRKGDHRPDGGALAIRGRAGSEAPATDMLVRHSMALTHIRERHFRRCSTGLELEPGGLGKAGLEPRALRPMPPVWSGVSRPWNPGVPVGSRESASVSARLTTQGHWSKDPDRQGAESRVGESLSGPRPAERKAAGWFTRSVQAEWQC